MMQPSAGNAKTQSSGPSKEPEQPKIAKERPNQPQTATDLSKKNSYEPRPVPLQKQKETAISATDTSKAGKDLGSGVVKAQQAISQLNLVPSSPKGGREDQKNETEVQGRITNNDQAQQLRERLYESFPEKKLQIRQVFEEFYANKFDLSDQVDPEDSKVDSSKLREGSPSSDKKKTPLVLYALPSFEQLVQKLKEQIGDAEFLEFFKKARSFDQLSESGAALGIPLTSLDSPDLGKIEDIEMGNGIRGAPYSVDQSDQFRYSSLESDPEKEFEHAKWIVLTTATPSVDEESLEKQRVEKQANMTIEKVNNLNSSQVMHQNNLPSGLIAPQKRYAHSACMAGNKMYIFAGLAQKKGNLQTLYSSTLYLDRLVPQSLYRWDKIKTDNPKARDSHTCIYMHDSLIMFGGSSVGKEYSFGDINKFDIKKKAWTKLEAMGEQPPPREAHIAHALGHDKMMIHGGINAQEETFNDTWVLIGLHAELDQMQSQIQRYINNEKYRQENNSNRHNLNELEFLRWVKCSQSGQIPESRDSHTSCIINDNIYMFGGQGKGEGIFFNDLYQLKIHPLESDNHIPQFHARFTQISLMSGPRPPPRTSHSCVSYKNRYLVVIGGENEEIPIKEDEGGVGADGDQSGAEENTTNVINIKTIQQNQDTTTIVIKDEAAVANEEPVEKSGDPAVILAPETTTMIQTNQPVPLAPSANNNQNNESANSEESEDNENESQSQALGDIWVFDTHLRRWMEIRAPLFIQGSGAGKRIRKQFEPRMAHSAVVIDQFVVVFGGLNKETNNLISNDLYVLCLNGVTNALLPKEKTTILAPPEDKKLVMKKPKLMKPLSRVESQSQLTGVGPGDTKPRAESLASGRSLEDQPSTTAQHQELGISPYLEQQERLEISGHIINSLINSKPGKKVNLAQMQREANEAYFQEQKGRDADSRTDKVYREAEVQTVPTGLTSAKPQGLNEDYLGSTVVRSHEPEQTRMNHVLSIAGQIQSPIVALASFIDNSVQAFQSQVVDQLNQKRGPPLKIDVSLVELETLTGTNNTSVRLGLQHLLQSSNSQLLEESKGLIAQKDNQNEEQKAAINGLKKSTRAFIKITDNGPGISPYRMRQTLTQFGLSPLRPSQSGPFDIAEHGVGLKIASLRLGQTSLILSKTSPQSQIGVQYFSVALISTEFVRKQHTPFLVAPLLCFSIRDKQSFHELTEHSHEMFAEIRKHCGLAKFATIEGLMDYALNEMDQKHGTHVYISDLKKTSRQDSFELRGLDSDICISHPNIYSKKLLTSNLALAQPWLVENSLAQFTRFMFLRHPQYLHLSINGSRVEHLSNPFNKLLISETKREQESWFSQTKTDEFAMQLLTTDFQNKIQQSSSGSGSDSQAFERSLIEQGLDRDELLHLLQGVLLYRGNRLVRRLQGRFSEMDEQARIISDLMHEEEITNSKQDNGEIRLGKRTFSQKNSDSQRDCLLSHLFKRSGIVSIYPHASQTSIERTDFQDKSIISRIKEKIDAEAIVQRAQ